jgi:hypothetical protein
MSGKKILALALAVVVGIIVVRILFAILSLAFTFFWWLVAAAIAAVIIFALYRGFMSMLTSGKRFT